ncbi:MAG: hypothetical protein PUB21_11665 [Bacteroidales bacterium]|nr:hypothetical protein [Bacteroidales bacterium]
MMIYRVILIANVMVFIVVSDGIRETCSRFGGQRFFATIKDVEFNEGSCGGVSIHLQKSAEGRMLWKV